MIEPRRVAQVTVSLDATQHRRLLERNCAETLAEGRRVPISETLRRLILDAGEAAPVVGPVAREAGTLRLVTR